MFWMATLWAYWRYVTAKSRGKEKLEIRSPKSERYPTLWYALTLFFFALALLSKPMAVTLPFVLLLLDYWPLRRIQLPITDFKSLFRLVLEKVPFLALSVAVCVLTIKAQSQAHSVVSTAGLPIYDRTAHALFAYAHYIGAMLLPNHLAVYYPYETAVPATKLTVACLVLALISLFAFRFGRKFPYLLVGWLWFLGTLVPVIGLVQVGDQAWADRYTYLPYIGLFIALVWGVSEILGAVGALRPTNIAKAGRGWQAQLGLPTAPKILAVGIAVALLILTSLQLRYWKNTRTLFEHAATVTQKNYMAVTLLGSLLAKEGKLDQAIDHYKTALSWKLAYAEAHFFLGNALDQQGKLDAAIAEYNQALRFKPMQEQTHILLGTDLTKKQQLDEAAAHYREALKLNPESTTAHNNLARLLQSQGRLEEAIEHYSSTLKLDPRLAEAHNNLGVLLLTRGNTTEGIRELREALRLNPGDLETEYNLALALIQKQEWSEPAELFSKILQTHPNDANAHYQLAVALGHLHKTREAMSHYASALLLQPDFPNALDGLAWILATSSSAEYRNGPQAVGMAERACELTSRADAAKLKTLAAAYAEIGDFNKAVANASNALKKAISSGRTNVSQECQAMITNFITSHPWRQ
jgi:tetratricopeptide (TPR) repeat protein